MHIIVEAIIVGICTLVIGGIISFFMMGKEAKGFQHWDRVLASYFFTGFLFHLLFEITGLNKKYCDNKM
jgi:hypothetical protein